MGYYFKLCIGTGKLPGGGKAKEKRGFVQIIKLMSWGTPCPAPTHLCTSGQTETNLKSWVFLGVVYSAASPAPGRNWPRCCHWDSGYVCWQFQERSSLSSVSNWYEMLDELSLLSSVCLQSCHLSPPPPLPPPQVRLFPNYGKQRHFVWCFFLPLKIRQWLITLSKAKACAVLHPST